MKSVLDCIDELMHSGWRRHAFNVLLLLAATLFRLLFDLAVVVMLRIFSEEALDQLSF
jgi:hypothetical protein